MQKVECLCLFDITATAVNGHQRNTQFPYTTRSGMILNTAHELNQARNQQRNLDTLLQLIGMRTQIFEITEPVIIDNLPQEFAWAGDARAWGFSFEIEPQSQWTVDGDDFWLLKNDSDRTPMILGLTETAGLDPWIVTQGHNINTIYHVATNK